jgi:tetratricopeptide (TPR) repeat protein
MKLVWLAVLMGFAVKADPCPGPEYLTLNNDGVRAHAKGDFVRAVDLLERSLAQIESCGNLGDPRLSTILSNLAESEVAAGRLSKGELHAAQAVQTASPRQLGRALSILGRVHTLQGRYQDAEREYRRSLENRESAATLNNLAECLLLQRRFDPALDAARRSLKLAKGGERASALNTMGRTHLALQQWELAETALVEALAIHERESGPRHPDAASVRNNLGSLAESRQRYAEAETWYRGALAAFEAVHGREHPETAKAMNNVAEVLALQPSQREADLLFPEALAICERTLPVGHPQTLQTAANYVKYLRRAGDRRARARLERKLTDWIKVRREAESGDGMIIDLRTLHRRE